MSCDEIECQAEPTVAETSDVSLETTAETTILESVGHASACDVWFSVPEEWGDNVLLRLYAMLGGFKVLLHRVKLGDASVLVEAGRLSGISISVRGRPCTSFQLTAQRVSGGSLEDGKFLLRVWADNDLPAVLGGAPVGEFGLSPTRAEPIVSLGAGYNTDSGDLADRFKLLRVNSSGALHVVADDPIDVAVGETLTVEGTGASGTPAGGVLTVQGPAAGVLSVDIASSGTLEIEGVGTGGSPAGGVVTVQGAGAAGVLTITGDDGGLLNVKGTRTPTNGMTNPVGVVDAGAFLFGWNGSTWDRVRIATPGDAMSNPSECIQAAGFMLGWNGSQWSRARIQPLASVSTISNASAPPSLASASFLLGYDNANSQWQRTRCDTNGILYTSPQGSAALADNVGFIGNTVAPSWSLAAHRNQGGNWYLSRGGYPSTIAAAAIPNILNVIGSGGYNATAPSPSNGDAAALQVDARASLVVVQGRPANDGRDTPSLIAFNGVDSGIIKNSAGNLLSIEFSNNHSPATAVWFHILNKATAPANGDTPIWRAYIVRPGVPYQISRSMLSEAGIRLTTGIAWAISTSRATVTLVGGTPDVAVNATYV